MADAKGAESRHGVTLTNLDQPLFDGAEATKRDVVEYLDGVADRILPVLADRPLSVIRVHRGQEAFMQKNVPKYTPEWVATVKMWAETSKREVAYALCNDRRTLLWFANQRAIEYHPTLVRVDPPDRMTHLVLDLDPPEGVTDAFSMAVGAAKLVRQALADLGLEGAVKTSGAKGVHVFVPIDDEASLEDAAAATRAIAARAAALDPDLATTAFMKEDRGGKVFVDATRVGGATVVAAYSPRVRPGVPVSFPLAWDDIDDVTPADFTVHTALEHLGTGPMGRPDAGAPATGRRTHRRGPRHPHRPGAGHARGQAPSPRPSRLARLASRMSVMTETAATGAGTPDDPWVLRTPPGTSEYQMYRDDTAEPAELVCVGRDDQAQVPGPVPRRRPGHARGARRLDGPRQRRREQAGQGRDLRGVGPRRTEPRRRLVRAAQGLPGPVRHVRPAAPGAPRPGRARAQPPQQPGARPLRSPMAATPASGERGTGRRTPARVR